MRKPVHITSLQRSENEIHEEIVFVVCDDGSVWQGDKFGDNYWTRLPDIPQSDGSIDCPQCD
jgi:hypothetical protein